MQMGLVALTQIVHTTPSFCLMEDVGCVNLTSELMMLIGRHVLRLHVTDEILWPQMVNALYVNLLPFQTVLEEFASNQLANP